MKKTPFLAYILAAMLSCAGIPHAEASTYYNVTLTDDEPSWDVAENNWYYTYTDSITGKKYACYDLFVEAKDGSILNGGWSSNIYIREGAKLAVDYLLQETDNPEDSELWKLLYQYSNDDYRLHINMENNSSLEYTLACQGLWLGVLHFADNATVNISLNGPSYIEARAIGKYTDRDFTINANIKTSSALRIWNEYTSTVTLTCNQYMSLSVERGINSYSPYIDRNGKICLPEKKYCSQLKGKYKDCTLYVRDGSGHYIHGYLGGDVLISLGNTEYCGLYQSCDDYTTHISWLLNNVEVREGCSAEMSRGYYGGTITLQKGSSLKFDMEIMPAGVDDANWDGGIYIIMKDSSMLDLAGRSLPAQYLDLHGTGLTVKNGTIAGNLTLQERILALQDIRFNQEDMLCLWGGATLNLSGQSFETEHLHIGGRNNTITNGSLAGALELANTDLKLVSILSMDPKVTLWGDVTLKFDKQPKHDIMLEVYGTNDIQDEDGLINTSGVSMASASALKVTGNISSHWIEMLSGGSLTATGDVIANRITGNSGSIYIGAQNIELNALSGPNLELYAESSVQVKGTAHAYNLKAWGKNVTFSALEIQPSLFGYAQIDADEDIRITQEFIGEKLHATAGGAITLTSLGNEANPVKSATIKSTGTGVTIEAFYGDSKVNLPLIVESAGKVVIGKSPEAGHGFPVVTGNMNIRYTGSGSGAESWDVEMLCELHGNLVVIAEQGRVSALTVKTNEYCDIYARQINLVSFVGDEMTLRASVSASVTKATAAYSLSIIGLNGELPDITIQSDMIAASMIELDGKNITATGIFSVLASSRYQISAANNVDIKGTFQGGKLALTAAGAVTLGAVGDSDNPVESANIHSTGGAVNISWGAVASGALSIEGTAVNIGESITAGNINIHSSSGDILIDKAVSCSSATMEAAGNITVNGQVSGSLTATAGGSITLASFVGGSLAASATGEIAVKDVTITGNQGSSLSSEALVVFNGNAHLQNTTVHAPLVNLGKWGLALTNKSSLEGDVTAAANSYIGLNDSTITGSVSGVETVELENSTITGSVSGAGTVELVNSTIGGAVDFSLLKAEGASRINSSLVLEDDSPCFSFFLDAANSTTPVLTLNGVLCQNPTAPVESLIISLDGNGSLETGAQYALLSHNSGQAPDFWNKGCVTVIGLDATTDDLFWQGGTLYFRCTKPVLQTAIWTGAVSGNWGGTDRNWVQGDYEYSYKDGVEVEFGDEGSGDGDVLLVGELAPTNVLVDNSEGHDYWFKGDGRLVGPTALVKEGRGSLTLFNDNEHTGGIIIRGGSVVLGGSAKSLGSGAIVVETGLLNLGSNTVSNDVTLASSDAQVDLGTLAGNLILSEGVSYTWSSSRLQITGNVVLENGATIDLYGKTLNANVILKGTQASISGTFARDITGENIKTLTLSGNLTCSGTITLAEGATLDLNSKGMGRPNTSFTLGGKDILLTDSTVGRMSGPLGFDSLVVAENSSVIFGTRFDTRFHFSHGITLMEGSALDLNGKTLSSTITLEGSATISGGTINDGVSVAAGKTLTLGGNLSGGLAAVTLGDNAVLALGGHTLSKAVALEGSASIDGGGTINVSFTVAAGKTLTLGGNLSGTGGVTLNEGSALALDGHQLAKDVTLAGSATIGTGTQNGSLTVGAGKTLTLGGNLSGTEAVTLGDSAVLALGGHTLSKAVALEGSATIGGGTLDGNVAVQGASGRLALQGVTIGDHTTFTMANEAELDLGGAEAWLGSFSATGQYATVDNGTLRVAEGMAALLGGNLGGTATVSLGEAAALDLNGHTLDNTLNMVGSSASIGGGSLGGALSVGGGKTLILSSDLEANGGISLAANAALDLGGYALGGDITVAAELITAKPTIIGGGSVDGDITLAGSNQEYGSARLTLSDSLNGTGTIYLGDQSELNLNGHAVGMDVATAGNNTKISGDGTINGNLTLSNTVDMKGSIKGVGTVILNNSVSLSAGDVYNDILVTRDKTTEVANILSGSFMGKVTVAEGARLDLQRGDIFSALVTLEKDSSLRLNGHPLIGSVALGQGAELQTDSIFYAVKALAPSEGESPAPGTLEQVFLSPVQLLGMDRSVSLADNLEIKSEADLLIESMTITANNEIYVGDHTITLKDVTIKMSDDIVKLEDGIFYFDLKSLINCELVMENILLDAGDLTLPPGFDPATTTVAFDFGDDVTIKQATGLDMRLGNYWSPTLNLDQQGKVIFTKLIPTPEPTTGTLSLLALAALAARRRRK